jgi:predicted ATPase/class 3 adenylate cyclase
VERKLLTILFADLVDSTALVASSDPEVARRRVGDFLAHVRRCVDAHGGTIGRYAGDAVMAAFGIPVAHEDDADRAVRAGLAILESVGELGLQARIGVEAGEVLSDEEDITFATGEAVNVAVRLQQAAAPGQLLLGPGAHRLTLGSVEADELGPLELKGLERPVWTWRATCTLDGSGRRERLAAPFVGREAELELLANTYRRVVRDHRSHLFTIFGEPGVGKSRLWREFAAGVEGATILMGRCLPYGEGITYWPLGEMVKAAAGITDDEPVKEAVDKLRACCEDEAVADLLGLASGVLEAVHAERSQEEIAWAVREWVEQLAEPQPIVLVFEDIHWAEEPLLRLIEHLAGSLHQPLLVICLTRPELLEIDHDWGGGRLRSTSIELEPLDAEQADQLVDALLAGKDMAPELRSMLLEKTGGNPLFVEETVRMVLERGDGLVERIPDTVQALIAARIDRVPAADKAVLQRAAVIGRVFWTGAVAHLAGGGVDVERPIDDLLHRDFVVRDARSSISGETAYRFKHVLIREVAYGGLSKDDRADLHTRFAEWLAEHAGEELLEIRAYHLDQASALRAELDGAPPALLAHESAAALEDAGKRALARDANRSARKLFLRALELEPTLSRRYRAARAAWRLTDLPVVRREMEEVVSLAREEGDHVIEGRALTALAEVAVLRDADVERARTLIEDALALLEDDDLGRFEALTALTPVEWSLGDLDAQERIAREALEIAQRHDWRVHEGEAVNELASGYLAQLRLDEAQPYISRSLALAEESGRIVARAQALRFCGLMSFQRGELDDAEASFEESRALLAEAGASWALARTVNYLGWVAWRKADPETAERHFREAIRLLKPIEDRAILCEVQRSLAQLLVELGRLDEAERYALEARETVGPQDRTSLATTTMALAVVRAAQGRDEEAQRLFGRSLATVAETEFRRTELEVLEAIVEFLCSRGRDEDASRYEERIAELRPAPKAAA